MQLETLVRTCLAFSTVSAAAISIPWYLDVNSQHLRQDEIMRYRNGVGLKLNVDRNWGFTFNPYTGVGIDGNFGWNVIVPVIGMNVGGAGGLGGRVGGVGVGQPNSLL
jgi:hypothetical protein